MNQNLGARRWRAEAVVGSASEIWGPGLPSQTITDLHVKSVKLAAFYSVEAMPLDGCWKISQGARKVSRHQFLRTAAAIIICFGVMHKPPIVSSLM